MNTICRISLASKITQTLPKCSTDVAKQAPHMLGQRRKARGPSFVRTNQDHSSRFGSDGPRWSLWVRNQRQRAITRELGTKTKRVASEFGATPQAAIQNLGTAIQSRHTEFQINCPTRSPYVLQRSSKVRFLLRARATAAPDFGKNDRATASDLDAQPQSIHSDLCGDSKCLPEN